MKLFKSIIMLTLSVVLAVSTTACQNADMTWAAKTDSHTMNIGEYLYYQVSAYDEASNLVSSDTEVLKAEIEGVLAEEWILNRALENVSLYFWANNLIEENDFDLTQEEIDYALSYTASLWPYYEETLVDIGISEESFNSVTSEFDIKFKKLFDYYYGEGGEYQIPKQDIIDYYVEGKYSYSYMYVSLTKVENDEIVDLTQEEIDDIISQFEYYETQVQTGYTTLENAAAEFAFANELSETPFVSDVTDLKYEYYPINFVEALEELDKGETKIFESEGQMVLLLKHDIDADAEIMYSDARERLNISLEMKSDEFRELALELSKDYLDNVTINQAAIDASNLSSLVTDDNKMGNN